MKTPQEQAEEMIFDLQLNSWSKAHILESIPLPELIAVAQAAKQYAGLVSECCMTGDRTGEVCDLHCALEALRATRKVEL